MSSPPPYIPTAWQDVPDPANPPANAPAITAEKLNRLEQQLKVVTDAFATYASAASVSDLATSTAQAITARATPQQITDAINALKANAPEAFDTLKEIADRIGPGGNLEASFTQALTGKLDATTAAVEARLPDRLSATSLARTSAKPVSLAGHDLGIPTITKYPSNPIITRAGTGLRSIYWPYLVRVPDDVYATAPTLGRWRLYYSTDHDSSTGQIGMAYCDAANPDDPGATWISWRHPTTGSAVMFTEGGSTQTETPTVIRNPITKQWLMYYQYQAGSGSTFVQYTKVATSPDGITWTARSTALPNPLASLAGYDHTGYAKVWYINGLWVCLSNLGGGAEVSGTSFWYSYDGFTWLRDPVKMRGKLEQSEGTLRSTITNLFEFRGQLWATGNSATFVSGKDTAADVQSWMAPINPDLRTLRGRPQLVPFAMSGTETTPPGIPSFWAAGPDGRSWGAYRINGAQGTIGLAVMSA